MEAPRPFGPISAALRFSVGSINMAVASLVCTVVSIPLIPWRRARVLVGNFYGAWVGYTCARLAGARLHFKHRERLDGSAPAIYVMNHASILDIWLGMWLCPVGGVGTAKKELVRVPFFGQFYWLSGHLLLDRANRGSAIAAMDKVAALVKKHRMSVWIWPEGTRSLDGRLLPLKKGFAHMALATRLPVVPVVVHDAHKVWPNKTARLIPGDVTIEVLEPISTTDWTVEHLDEHIAEVHSAFRSVLGPHQQPRDAVGMKSTPIPE